MRALAVTFALSVFVAGSTAMLADPIPYGNVGNPVTTVSTLTATGTSVGIYFYGSIAIDSDYIEVYDLGTNANAALTDPLVTNTGQIFHVQGPTKPAQGTLVTLSTTVGDILLVELINTNGFNPPYDYFNDPTRNVANGGAGLQGDSNNHFYVTPFTASDTMLVLGMGGANDYFVGVEDRAVPGGDEDYNDEQLVLTGVTTGIPMIPSSTPEPGSIALLGTGILGAAGMIRRRMMAS